MLYMNAYVTFGLFAYIIISADVSPSLRDTSSAIFMKLLCYCLGLRCFGVMLISLQRFLVICRWSSSTNTVILSCEAFNTEPEKCTELHPFPDSQLHSASLPRHCALDVAGIFQSSNISNIFCKIWSKSRSDRCHFQ